MRFRFSPRARADLEEIFEFLRERSRSSAQRVVSALHASIRLLKDYPNLAQESTIVDVRVQSVPRYRYQIFCRIQSDVIDIIDIIHVRHSARKPFIP